MQTEHSLWRAIRWPLLLLAVAALGIAVATVLDRTAAREYALVIGAPALTVLLPVGLVWLVLAAIAYALRRRRRPSSGRVSRWRLPCVITKHSGVLTAQSLRDHAGVVELYPADKPGPLSSGRTRRPTKRGADDAARSSGGARGHRRAVQRGLRRARPQGIEDELPAGADRLDIGRDGPAALEVNAADRCAQRGQRLELGLRHLVTGWQPLAGIPVIGWLPGGPCADVQADFCPAANLFCDAAHLAAWREAAGDPPGRAATLSALAEVGR